MLELPADLRLFDEARDERPRVLVALAEDLHRDVAAEVGVTGVEDHPHAAAGDLAEDLVATAPEAPLAILPAAHERRLARGVGKADGAGLRAPCGEALQHADVRRGRLVAERLAQRLVPGSFGGICRTVPGRRVLLGRRVGRHEPSLRLMNPARTGFRAEILDSADEGQEVLAATLDLGRAPRGLQGHLSTQRPLELPPGAGVLAVHRGGIFVPGLGDLPDRLVLGETQPEQLDPAQRVLALGLGMHPAHGALEQGIGPGPIEDPGERRVVGRRDRRDAALQVTDAVLVPLTLLVTPRHVAHDGVQKRLEAPRGRGVDSRERAAVPQALEEDILDRVVHVLAHRATGPAGAEVRANKREIRRRELVSRGEVPVGGAADQLPGRLAGRAHGPLHTPNDGVWPHPLAREAPQDPGGPVVRTYPREHVGEPTIELRALVIPTVEFRGIWLHGQDGPYDRLVSAFETHGLERRRLSRWSEVREALLPRARQVAGSEQASGPLGPR